MFDAQLREKYINQDTLTQFIYLFIVEFNDTFNTNKSQQETFSQVCTICSHQ